MGVRVTWREDFLTTGLWTGIRIYLLPVLLFLAFLNFGETGKAVFQSRLDAAFAPAKSALPQINAALGGSRLPGSLTPGPGAKWVRP